jgi:hypothetical protein
MEMEMEMEMRVEMMEVEMGMGVMVVMEVEMEMGVMVVIEVVEKGMEGEKIAVMVRVFPLVLITAIFKLLSVSFF